MVKIQDIDSALADYKAHIAEAAKVKKDTAVQQQNLVVVNEAIENAELAKKTTLNIKQGASQGEALLQLRKAFKEDVNYQALLTKQKAFNDKIQQNNLRVGELADLLQLTQHKLATLGLLYQGKGEQ